MGNGIHVGDVGTTITITIVDEDGTLIDISGASTKTFRLEDPVNAVEDKTAVFTTDGTDGKLYYTLIANDIDVSGNWRLQAILVFPTATNYSSILNIPVYDNLEAPA